ncbi:MAG: DeoR/GlpR transcriptional regulator [Ruminococcaceae bacterium]|nr:DeoR/GlpR transcriptional regulator [Oscillospiraceae bacterium]
MKSTEINEQQIINHLKIHKSISINDAIRVTDSSESTVRRTFKRLEATGNYIRSYGGIRLASESGADSDYYYEHTENRHVEAKLTISTLALSLVESEDVIYLDSGTTLARFAAKLAEALDKKQLYGVKIFTNSLVNLNLLKRHDITLIGGKFRDLRKDFYGYTAEDTLKTLHFKKCFLGADAYSTEDGFTTTDFHTARLNELVLERSERKYVLMDSSKFFASSIVSYSRRISPDMVISEAHPDRSYPETADIPIKIMSAEKSSQKADGAKIK